MSSVCQSCSLKINSNQCKIECSVCKKRFHGSCMNITSGDISYLAEKGEFWSCPDCIASVRRQRGSLSDSPIARPKLATGTSVREDQLTVRHFEQIMEEFNRAGAVRESLSTKLSALIETQAKLSQAVESCNERLSSHAELLQRHSASIAQGDERIGKLENSVAVLEQKVEGLADSAHISSTDVAQSSAALLGTEALLSEIRSREQRSNNLMLFGVPESANSSRQQRIAEDTRRVGDVMRTLELEIQALKVLRVGKVGARPRPLKLVLSSRLDVNECLKNRNKLRGSDFRIASDQTELQRSHLRELRGQLKTRVDNGETDVTIKFVEGVPRIVKSTVPKK